MLAPRSSLVASLRASFRSPVWDREFVLPVIKRQWMPTPWIRITRDGSGKVSAVEGIMPGLNDLYPFNPYAWAHFHMNLAIPAQIVAEIAAGKAEIAGGQRLAPPQESAPAQ